MQAHPGAGACQRPCGRQDKQRQLAVYPPCHLRTRCAPASPSIWKPSRPLAGQLPRWIDWHAKFTARNTTPAAYALPRQFPRILPFMVNNVSASLPAAAIYIALLGCFPSELLSHVTGTFGVWPSLCLHPVCVHPAPCTLHPVLVVISHPCRPSSCAV